MPLQLSFLARAALLEALDKVPPAVDVCNYLQAPSFDKKVDFRQKDHACKSFHTQKGAVTGPNVPLVADLK